jgi:hypothetical protein
VRVLLLCLPLVFAAPAKKQWSKAHGIGVTFPNSWTILERDKGQRAFVVEGPVLGAGKPHLVVWNAGAAGDRTLRKVAEKFDGQLRKRAGWRRTAMAAHKVGPWRAMRIGYAFQEGDNAKGRARVSVIMYGGCVYIIEMSAAARGFPAATFDAIERSLEAKWAEHTLPDGSKARTPPGWEAQKTEQGLRARGPRQAMVHLAKEGPDATGPPGEKEAGKVRFLGARREATVMVRKMGGEEVRLLWVHHGEWVGVIMMPTSAWDEVAPGAEAILASLKLPKKEPARGSAD